MTPKDFHCKQCGNCCLTLGDAFATCVTDEDIHLWEERGRDDILGWVDPIPMGGGQYVYDIWINPATGEDVQRCPWLRKLPNKDKYICRIHEVKPQHCREYPRSKKHAEKTGCSGFESN
jgi:Fe-S-cluster containining protein